MIDPTDEMERAMVYGGSVRERLAAVLAIVERDQSGPCSVTLPRVPKSLGGVELWCELRHGHAGDHESGVTRWKHFAPAARWRCNTTERCFREDGHDGPHGFAGTNTASHDSSGDLDG